MSFELRNKLVGDENKFLTIVVEVSCVSNESTPTNFYMWSRVMMSSGQKRNEILLLFAEKIVAQVC